ncbi:hypothetical protein MLD38_006266 [Melastoma candidum]|uniref:Uncharacterized protein n=1 Tax=Melastoma candidum TaxID=119954 RepID=A0ACB9RMB8_9MYRT|nr:hypothetical protein MLD38_006266 [Melastoma candidum]
MASQNGGFSISTSPKALHGGSAAVATSTTSPKGQCLCSPTTHQGSFRCRFHRTGSSAWMKRSNSMPTGGSSASSLSPKSHDSK